MRGLAAALCLLAAACSSTPDNGYAVDLTITRDSSVTQDLLGTVAIIDITVGGAETAHRQYPVTRPFAAGDERVVYRPKVGGGALDFAVALLDASNAVVGGGSALGVALKPKKTVTAKLTVSAGEVALPDGGLSGPDGSAICVADGTADTCSADATSLHRCKADGSGFDDINCALGCDATSGTAHCRAFVPTGTNVTPDDLTVPGVAALNIVADTTINTDTGEITGLRAINVNPGTREVKSGIAFHVAGNIGIYTVASVSIADGKKLSVVGDNAFALVSEVDVNVLGVISLTAQCSTAGRGGPGGSPGGVAHMNGMGMGGGPGAPVVGYNSGGGYGGSYGDVGGTDQGGAYMPAMTYGTPELTVLYGGSGGGGAGNAGGGGGGAIHLIAGGAVVIGSGSTAAAGINAGGCGSGSIGTLVEPCLAYGTGGGGSGGAILIEASSALIGSMGILAANGGGGAGGYGAAGSNGLLSVMAAPGGVAMPNYNVGGSGGAASYTPGGFGFPPTGTGGCAGPTGGGGGVGRIRVNTYNGMVTVLGAFSPPKTAAATSLTTFGTIKLQ